MKALGPNYMKMNISKFYFNFCSQHALIMTFYDFNLSFLKIVLKSILYGLLQGKLYLLFSMISEKIITHPSFLGNPSIPHFKLYLFMYLMQ